MKKIIPVLLLLIGCTQNNSVLPTMQNKVKEDSTIITFEITTIQEIVDWANSQEYTKEEAEYWDSLSTIYAYPVRDAERELDTIVNHLRIHFYKYE